MCTIVADIRARAGVRHIQVSSLCVCHEQAVTMETELWEECSRYYGDEKNIRSPTTDPPKHSIITSFIHALIICQRLCIDNINRVCESDPSSINHPEISIFVIQKACIQFVFLLFYHATKDAILHTDVPLLFRS